ncbi:hypothetical protein K439DRAFT_260586 [Ramaria rubella]|nr:hypothetical protein K439DRAFT_260586 [Ramaria rubella]
MFDGCKAATRSLVSFGCRRPIGRPRNPLQRPPQPTTPGDAGAATPTSARSLNTYYNTPPRSQSLDFSMYSTVVQLKKLELNMNTFPESSVGFIQDEPVSPIESQCPEHRYTGPQLDWLSFPPHTASLMFRCQIRRNANRSNNYDAGYPFSHWESRGCSIKYHKYPRASIKADFSMRRGDQSQLSNATDR